jgi:hypothetical protein
VGEFFFTISWPNDWPIRDIEIWEGGNLQTTLNDVFEVVLDVDGGDLCPESLWEFPKWVGQGVGT